MPLVSTTIAAGNAYGRSIALDLAHRKCTRRLGRLESISYLAGVASCTGNAPRSLHGGAAIGSIVRLSHEQYVGVRESMQV